MSSKIIVSATILIFSIFLLLPIWFYLMFKVLQLVNATQLMWFLFWVYIPISVLIHILSEIWKHLGDD